MTESHYHSESCNQHNQWKRIRLSLQANVFVANVTIIVYAPAGWTQMQINHDNLHEQKQQVQLLLLVSYHLPEFGNPTKTISNKNNYGVKCRHVCALHAFAIYCVSAFKCLFLVWLSVWLIVLTDGMCEITCNGLSSEAGKCSSGLLVAEPGPEILSLRLLGR